MQNHNILTAISNIFLECNLCTLPIDCFAVLRHYGFKNIPYSQLSKKSPELYFLCSQYSSDAFMHRAKRIVAYNDFVNQGRIRFSLMHEFGHFILGHKGSDIKNEEEADEFASHFLAPRILIHKYGYRTADEIHEVFGLSYAASNRTLADYHNWLNNICHTTRKPSAPELELEQLFFPKIIEKPINCISDKRSHKKRKRNTKIKKELEEKIAFVQELYLQRGEEYLFAMAEHQKLYGNDL